MGELYQRHRLNLYHYFYRCSQDRSEAEDMVQNVFIKLIHKRNRYKEGSEFTHWLFKVARNAWIDKVRKKDALYQSLDIDKALYELEDKYSSVQAQNLLEQKDRMQRALQHISPDKRDAIVLSRYHGMDYKTIAEISDCTVSTIKSRVMRGIQELKTLVKEDI